MDTGSLNYCWSLSILHAYVLSGVQHAVISPGSRSTPLTLACERHPDITTWVQVDERSAAFFALGLAIKSKLPVVLVCTSGSAVANWLPAVVEANYSLVPLILLSADRPIELQDCGANQTIDQTHLFGPHVRAFHALPEPVAGLMNSDDLQKIIRKSITQLQQPLPGAIHINIPFREPLLPKKEGLNERIDDLTRSVINQSSAIQVLPNPFLDDHSEISAIVEKMQQGTGVIVLGRKRYSLVFIEVLNQLAETFGLPVLVDHLSNLRFGAHEKSNYIVNYDLFLRQIEPQGRLDIAPEWVVRFGQFPVSKSLADFLMHCSDATTVVVGENNRWQDPLRSAEFLVQSSDEAFCRQLLNNIIPDDVNHDLMNRYRRLDDIAAVTIDSTLQMQPCLFEGHLLSTVLEKIPENSFIFTSNSTLVRELDTYTVLNQSSSKSISLYCNRGASGIDGNLSTYLGLLAENSAVTGVALLGDLAFLHDMNGLALCARLNDMGYKGTIIIVNNGGGHIFNSLPQNNLHEFEKYWLTPVKMDIFHAAAAFALNYQRVDTVETLKRAIDVSLAEPCIDIIEAVIDPQISTSSHELLLTQFVVNRGQ